MATIYYNGNQRTRAVEYAVTVSSVSVGQTITATINGKTETYTSTTATAASAASAAVTQFGQSLFAELANFSFTSSGAVITAVGPANGAPLTITWGGTATLSGGGSPSVTALSPANIADTANYVGGALAVNGDTLVVENYAGDLLWNLNQYASNTVTLVRRASHTGRIGLDDTNALGYPEYLPTHFVTAATAGTIEDGGSGTVRVQSTAATAATYTVTGAAPGTLGSENVELYGTPASSVIHMNGGSLAFCPLGAQTGTGATVLVANAAFRTGSGATLGTANANNSQCAIGGPITTYTQDRGTTTTFGRASAGTTLNIEDGVVNHASTGGWTTVNVQSGGTFDTTYAPSTVAITTVNLYEGGTLTDPNERIVKPYTLNVNGELSKMTLDIGTTVALTVG